MSDIYGIEETMYENFSELCAFDPNISELVWEHFADRVEQYHYWKNGMWSEEPEMRAFDAIFNADAEAMHHDMKGTIEKYFEDL